MGLSESIIDHISDSFQVLMNILKGLVYLSKIKRFLSTNSGTSGLGPMKRISPLITLKNCGNSSNFVFLKNLPNWLLFHHSHLGMNDF